VGRKRQQGAQCLIQFGILDGTGLDFQHVLKIVEQDDRSSGGECLGERLDGSAGRGLGILVNGIELLDRVIGQELDEAGIQVGNISLVK